MGWVSDFIPIVDVGMNVLDVRGPIPAHHFQKVAQVKKKRER